MIKEYIILTKQEIIDLYADGKTVREIAAVAGCTYQNISRILRDNFPEG